MNSSGAPAAEGAVAPANLHSYIKSLPFLGRLDCERKTLTVGEWTELTLTYEIGAVGLADGGWLKLAFKFYSDWALFQTSDPTGANYVSAEYHTRTLLSGQSPSTVRALKVRFDQKGHERPFQKAVIIDVVDGYLNPGDRIVIRLGDRRQGGAGTRVQTFVEKDFRFRMFVDPLGSSKFAEVPGDCAIDIVPGAPHVINLIAPRLVTPGQTVRVVARVDDIWGNTCRDIAIGGQLNLSGPDGSTRQEALEFTSDGWAVAQSSLSFLETGEWALQAEVIGMPVEPAIAYVQAEAADTGFQPYYADLHVHSEDTVGTNDTYYNLSYGRDIAALDIVGYTVNDFNITEAKWNEAVGLIGDLNESGRFVCYPGTEWCGNSAAGGDRNVIFLRDGKPRFPFDEQGRSVRSFEWNEFTSGTIRPGVWPVDELWAAYEDDPEGHLMIPHVGGRRCIFDWHHPELERLTEITSAWGQFHWNYIDALSRGHRVGASAASDEHQGRCGGGAPATAVFGSRGGLTGVFAEALDRTSVGKALRARRTFATTGERSFASLRLGESWMGEVVHADPAVPLVYRLLGDKGWEEASLFDADRQIWTRNLHREAGFSNRRVRLRFGGARIKDRYRAAYWQGEISVTGAALLGHKGIGFDHPEQCAWRKDGTTVGFQSATHGDIDGVELSLSQLAGTKFEIRTSLYGYVKVGDPLQPPPHIDMPSANLIVSGDDLLAAREINLDIPGVELRLSLECISEAPLPRDVGGEIDIGALNLEKGREHPLFITARQIDQSRVWTSPLFLNL
jgi:hypothetical protein